jgi:hypothetical protein
MSSVQFGTSDDDFCLASIKSQLVFVTIMAYNVQCTLKSTCRFSDHVCIVSDTDCGYAQWSYPEAKVGVVEGVETRVDVSLEVTAGTDMTLPIAFVFLNFPAQLPILFEVAFGVFVSVSTVQKILYRTLGH